MKREYYNSPKGNYLMRLFWKAAGADRYVLEQSTYSDQVKYACLGGIVVATGFMAAIAGGYAMYTIFEPKGDAIDAGTHLPTAIKAIFFGIVWGLIIFNIDRFIVAATGKGDGTEAITTQEIKSALPRMIMGLIIALTISKPVEIRMFKTEIDIKLQEKQDELAQQFIENRTYNLNERKKEKIDKIKLWKQEIEAEKTAFFNLQKEYYKEMDGGAGVGGRGPEAIAKEGLMNDQRVVLEEIKESNGALIKAEQAQLAEMENQLINIEEEAKQRSKGLDGLLKRIQLAHEVAGFWISFFITLLFVVIELTPIFFKMMLTKSPYDFMDDNIKELLKAEKGIQIKYDYYEDREGQERNLVINHQAEQLIKEKMGLIAAQSELSEYVLNKWKEKEKEEVDKDVSKFISGN